MGALLNICITTPRNNVQVLEDVSEDYAKKTVTVETFPHYKLITAASIHPCKHAVTMRKLASMMETDGKTFPVDR